MQEVGVIFLEGADIADDEVGAEAVHRQRFTAGGAQLVIHVGQRGGTGDQHRIAIGKHGLGGNAVRPFGAGGAHHVRVKARQAARHADGVGKPGGRDVVAIVGAHAIVPHLHVEHGRVLRMGQAQLDFQAQHARCAQFQGGGLDGRHDQRHARMLALGQEAALLIDHHPFAVEHVPPHQP
ncbi:hypothetical protein D3C81_1523710 [compost metagenome]